MGGSSTTNNYTLWYDHDDPILDVGDFSQVLPEDDNEAEEVMVVVMTETLERMQRILAAREILIRPRDEFGHYIGAARPFND